MRCQCSQAWSPYFLGLPQSGSGTQGKVGTAPLHSEEGQSFRQGLRTSFHRIALSSGAHCYPNSQDH